MLGSYLKIAWRNLVRDRQFSVLNLIGLSVGFWMLDTGHCECGARSSWMVEVQGISGEIVSEK